jgi:SAM-dependent methyltransferase
MSDSSQITVFDRALVRRRRDRAALRFAAHVALFEETAAQIIERLDGIKQDFRAALDLGAHDGRLAARLVARGIPFVAAADFSPAMIRQASGIRLAADEEFLPFAAASFDLIVSNLSLHWVNDLPGALAQIKRALRPGGLFLAALIGGDSLHELRSSLMEAELTLRGGTGPRLSPMIAPPTASALLQRAGFSLPVTDGETLTLAYPDMMALLRDLRGMGETATHRHRPRGVFARRIFAEAERLYRARFTTDEGGLPASFEIVFLHGVAGAPAGI